MTRVRETEAEFQTAVIDLAQAQGWLTYHPFDSRRSTAGYPDCTFVRERLVMAELKAETGKLSVEQTTWFAALMHAGVEVYVWRPSQWPEIVELLKRPVGVTAA